MSALVDGPELHQLSIEEYHRLVACGGFDESTRVELIDGLVVDMSPRTPRHEKAIRWLTEWLFDRVDRSGHEIMVAGSLTIGSSEPEPDLTVIERDESRPGHPTSALLVIEVAVGSRDRDLRTKPIVYAQAVAEYWVVDLERECVVVHRDEASGSYRDISIVPDGGEVRARSIELAPLQTRELFDAALGRSR